MDMSTVLDGAEKVIAGSSVLVLLLAGYTKWRGATKVSKVLKGLQAILGVLALNVGKKHK